jgi:hypothetical protein
MTMGLQLNDDEWWRSAREVQPDAVLDGAISSIIACLYGASQKLSRTVGELCSDGTQPWTPFSVEASVDTIESILRVTGVCEASSCR